MKEIRSWLIHIVKTSFSRYIKESWFCYENKNFIAIMQSAGARMVPQVTLNISSSGSPTIISQQYTVYFPSLVSMHTISFSWLRPSLPHAFTISIPLTLIGINCFYIAIWVSTWDQIMTDVCSKVRGVCHFRRIRRWRWSGGEGGNHNTLWSYHHI